MKVTREELNNMRCISNNVLIRVDHIANDKITLSGGQVLYLDTEFQPDNAMNVVGTIMAQAEKIYYNKKDDPQKSLGWLTTIETKVGDTVYMDYCAIAQAYGKLLHKRDESVVTDQVVMCEDEIYVFLNYGNLIFAKRGDEIVMLNGYVLCEPVQETTLKDTLLLQIPDYIKTNKSNRYGKVAYKGSLNRDYFDFDNSGDNFDVEVGDVVSFEKYFDIEVEYDMTKSLTKPYFRIQRSHITGLIPKSMFLKCGIIDR